jgi:hypothetical protein
MGLVPAACNRVGVTTDGAARDVRRDHGVSQCRVGLARTVCSVTTSGQAALACVAVVRVPWAVPRGGQLSCAADTIDRFVRVTSVCGTGRPPGSVGVLYRRPPGSGYLEASISGAAAAGS